jgi:hypothetical protein
MVGLLLAAAGCGGSGSIVGKWADSGGAVWEFTEDGEVLMGEGAAGGVAFTYTVEGGRLSVSALGNEVIAAQFTVEGDTLKLTNPDAPGQVETMKRVR